MSCQTAATTWENRGTTMGDAYGQPVRNADGATAALVCGIIGLLCCGILSVIAWVQGSKALAQIEASGGTLGGRSNASVGRILGIIGTVLWILGIVVGAFRYNSFNANF